MEINIKDGYKVTEVGVIPDDWNCQILSTIISIPIQNGVFNNPLKKGRGYKLINVSDLYSSVPIDCKKLELFDASKDEITRFYVVNGDIFFTRSSLTPDGIAHCNIYKKEEEEEIVFDCHIIRVRGNIDKIEPFFLFRYCLGSLARKYLISHAKTTTMTTIDQSVIANLPILVPPLAEQKAIAHALSDVDNLITAIDQLITKKRNLKQGTMQELLTGKKRLPGFSGKWEVKKLGDILKVKHGKSQHNIIDENGKFPILATGGEIGKTNTYLYNKPSVLIGRKGTIDIPQYMDTPFWTIDTLFYTEIFNNAVPKFVFYKFNLINWYSYNEASGVPSLNAKTIENIDINFPKNVLEQKAIAEILTDMDKEIEALEKKRDKYKTIKQGMMQELLTGKTRIIDN